MRKQSKIFSWRVLLIFSAVALIASAVTVNKEHRDIEAYRKALGANKNKKESIKAWGEVYKVLMHPRCMNCHPAGDIPLQGEDSHVHNMLPQRGVDGTGVLTMHCGNCHHNEGVPGENTPPGNPHWKMPPADMKMVFEGRSARELALQMVDQERNGHKSIEDLIEHASDTLVKEGWHMGGDRELPPLTYEEWKAQWLKWIETGAYAPEANNKTK